MPEPTESQVGILPFVENTDMEDTRTIHQRMWAILRDMPAIGKTTRNEQQNFNYRSHDDVMNALNPLMSKHGVIVLPRVLKRVTDERKTRSGNAMYEVNLCVAYDFYGLLGDYISATVWGEGTDTGDKATSKALTMAFKQAIAQAFAVSTAEFSDPDGTTAEASTGRTSRERQPVREQKAGFPVPHTWAEIEMAVKACDNPDEAWALFAAFLRAAAYHLYGETDQSKLDAEKRMVLVQKASGAAVALHENMENKGQFEMGEFRFFTEERQREAWAEVLTEPGKDLVKLAIPDYVAPEPVDPQEAVDEETAELARQTLADNPPEPSEPQEETT